MPGWRARCVLSGQLLAQLGRLREVLDGVSACVAIFPQPRWEALRVKMLSDSAQQEP